MKKNNKVQELMLPAHIFGNKKIFQEVDTERMGKIFPYFSEEKKEPKTEIKEEPVKRTRKKKEEPVQEDGNDYSTEG